MFVRTLCLSVVVALLQPAAANAGTGHLIDRWSVEEGLPNNALASIVQSRDGYLWIATWAGTVRFDGVRFTPITERLPNDHARVLFEDRAGAMWIGVAGTGLVRWRAGQVEVLTPADGLAGRDVRAIVQDQGGRIWAGTENGVSIVTADRGMRTLRVAQGLPHDTVNALAVSRDGRVFVATAGGLCVAAAAEARCTAVSHAPAGPANTVLEDRDGGVWVGTPAGLQRMAGTAGSACHRQCLPDATITTVLQTRDGALWAGLGTGGVARIDAAGIQHFGVADGLQAGTVVTLHEDAEGSVWVGVYNGGLARIKPARLTTITTADGLPAEVVGSIVQDRHGTIWAGTQCGPVSMWRDGRFVPQFVDEMRGACAWVLWAAGDGTLWIGTRGSGVYRWAAGRLEHFDLASGLSDLHIAGLFEDRDGTIWIGTEFGGVHTYRDGRLSRAYGTADGVAVGYVASFAQDADGRIWIGSNANGLSVYEAGRFRTLPPEESPPTRNIAGLLIDSRNDLWIGSAANGLFRRRRGENRYESFGVAQGLGDRLVAVMLEDTGGHLWVGTARGISRLDRARLEAVAAGRADSLDPILLDRSDGMRNPEGSGGGLDPSGLRDRDGRLWFSTIDGIAVIDPAAFAVNRVVPRVRVESMRLDERPAARRDDGVFEVPAGTSSVEFAYTAFSFLDPSQVRFKYRLAGFDEVWHDVGTRRAAYYSRLPPGEYTLELLASNNDAVWTPAPVSVPVVVLPFFWERPAARAAGLALLLVATAVLGTVVAQRRARRRLADLERERALERERTRIARDLHDDLGSRLTHIALMADTGAATSQVSVAVRHAVESLDELVWAVNARHDTVEGFATYAARFAEEHVAAAGLRVRLQFAPDLQTYELRAETRRHLYLAYKEAVNNAVKHARATEIHVVLHVVGSMLQLEVADDGRGLGAGDPTGNGLTNMRERMESVGGSVAILARRDGGVQVVFRVPIASGAHLHALSSDRRPGS